MEQVKLISITPDAEKTMTYIARVSNPNNQDNPNIAGLLKYCIKHHHWSVFEQATMTLEITTTRDISAQIIRHKSFQFQEFSQRYCGVDTDIPMPEWRAQDTSNRQSSLDTFTREEKEGFSEAAKLAFDLSVKVYESLLEAGVAKECARKVLPMNTPTKIYMTGSIRSWIHYIDLRSGNGTQKEHQEIAIKCREIFKEQLPVISEALEWS